GNFYMLRYEELSNRTEETVRKLYNFLGINHSEEVFGWIKENTKNPNNVVGGMSTTGRNSIALAYRWQNELTTKEKTLISNVCQETLKVYNY
ncbi:hypothetical protein CAPTEDRAFT_87599, partial [Capitella teleta]